MARRSPYGERGLKSEADGFVEASAVGRSPYGERGLKLGERGEDALHGGRSPYGERGLKFILYLYPHLVTAVALLTESVD